MKNKTCKSCKYHHIDYHYCYLDKEYKSLNPENEICVKFKPLTTTNGEKLKSKSNLELAIFFMAHFTCEDCPAKTETCKKPASCVDAWAEHLNKEIEK